MKHYNFVQGLLIGILVWGGVSVGLRYIHYTFEAPIPRILIAPGRIMTPFMAPEEKHKWIASREPMAGIDTGVPGKWEAIKEFVGLIANLMTIVVPLISGTFSFLLWRKQRI